MNIFKFKTVLFALVGFILYISHMMLYREISADSDYPFFSAVFFLMFMSFWAGIGVLLTPSGKRRTPWFLFPVLCLPPATLAGLVIVQLLSACCIMSDYAMLPLLALFGCCPPGICFGLMLAVSRETVVPVLVKPVALFGALGYLCAAFILYPLNLFNVLANPVIYTFCCNFLILVVAVAVAVLKLQRAKPIRYWFLTFAAILIAVNFSFLQLEKFSAGKFFEYRYPDWERVKSYLTHDGRITLLSKQADNKNKDFNFLILENNRIQQRIPEDSTLYKTNAIPLSLQPDKKNISILAIASPFSVIPAYMAALPYVREVNVLTPGRDALPLNILRNFCPPPTPGVRIINSEVLGYLQRDFRKYDIIFFLFPDRRYLNFDKILELCAARLKKKGTLAVPVRLLAANNALASCRKLFRNKIFLPGKSLVNAFSDGELCTDLHVLEQRLAEYDTGETKIFPPGTFSVIYSIPRPLPVMNTDIDKLCIENRLLRIFSSLGINLRHIFVLLALVAVYFSARFMLLRRKPLNAAVALFENGVSLMLIMMFLMVVFALKEGAYYFNFGIMLSALSGVPVGIFLSRFKVRRMAVIISVLLIFLCLGTFSYYQIYYAPLLAFLNFICGGIIVNGIFAQYPAARVKLLTVHFLAAALGAVILFTLLIMRFELLSCLFVVILLRLPLAFSRMALGKIDFSGVRS
jgi:hypothetical protein